MCPTTSFILIHFSKSFMLPSSNLKLLQIPSSLPIPIWRLFLVLIFLNTPMPRLFPIMVSAVWFWLASASSYALAGSLSLNSSVPPQAAAVAVQTCQQLESTLGSPTVQTRFSGGPEYDLGANAAWNLFNTEINFQPTCIVFVNSTKDVQVTMKAIWENGADYAVQAGGHSAMVGWNTIENGVLISFLFMNGTSYDSEKDTITLLPGIHWEAALSTLEPFGVAPVGGRINSVGTGLLLGGGLSYLSPVFGYAADTYVSLDVVLVNGTLVTATVDNEYADLFQALKGGANRFGIVTRYEVQAVHVGREGDKRWWGGLVLYPNSSSEALLNAIAHYAHDVDDTNAVMFSVFDSIFGNSTFDSIIELVMFYNGTSESFNATFAEFLSIPSEEASLGPLSYMDIANSLLDTGSISALFGASVLEGIPAESASNGVSSMSLDSEDPYITTFKLFSNFSATFASSNKINSAILAFTPILDSQIRVGYARGGNAISPPLGRGGFNAVQFEVEFNEGITEVPEEIEQGRQYYFTNAPNTPGLPLYINECDAQQRVYETYGGYELLKEVYAKYDPTRFNVQHTRGPLGL